MKESEEKVVGYVLKPEFYKKLQKASGAPWSPHSPLVRRGGVAIYTDAEHEEDCLQFQDERGLELYLNRKTDPKGWESYLKEGLTRDGRSE